MKKLIIICLFLFPAIGFAQDTIYAKKVPVVNIQLSRKTNKIQKISLHYVRVKSGMIIRQPDGRYLVNKKLMSRQAFGNDSLLAIRQQNKDDRNTEALKQ